MARQVTIPGRQVLEEIRSVEHVEAQHVRVVLGTGKVKQVLNGPGSTQTHEEFVWDPNQQFTFVMITEENYAELMSAAPAWAPNKPAGEFRKADLWQFIDRIRAA